MRQFFAIALLLGPSALLQAASVQWHTTEVPQLYKGEARCLAYLSGTHVQVSYGAEAVTDAGERVCGGVVVKGTRVRFEFQPHTFTDIVWNGTGHSWDSPYGSWVAGAAPSPRADFCHASNYIGGESGYAAFSVAPPSKAIIGNAGFSSCAGAADGSRTCIASSPGSWSTRFNWAGTFGKFYATQLLDPNACRDLPRDGLQLNTAASWHHPYDGTGWQSCSGTQPFALAIPAQSVSCPISIIEPRGQQPEAPIFNTAPGAACVAMSPYSLTLLARDPDGDAVRFGIDWNSDGLVDEVLPAAAIPSGDPFTVSHAFAVPGVKSVRAYALDAAANRSPWSSVSFACERGLDTRDITDTSLEGGGSDDWEATLNGVFNGQSDDAQSRDLNLRVIPSLVRSGARTVVHWSSTAMATCTVTAPNDDAWSGVSSAAGGEVTRPITQSIVYTLDCSDRRGEHYVKTVPVKVVPSWREQ